MDILTLYRPLRTKRISQSFGQSTACITHDNKVVRKVNGFCPSGSRDLYQSLGMKGHNGHDVPLLKGEQIVHCATFDGWMKTEVDRDGGIGVDVVSNEKLFFAGKPPFDIKAHAELATRNGVQGYLMYVKIRYWHLLSVVGHDGKPVTLGQVIGLGDSTGLSSGHHLHWSPKWCDKDGNGLGQGNRYYGAFDPTPFYQSLHYAPDMVLPAPPPLTPEERKQVSAQLSLLERLLLVLSDLLTRLKN